MNQLTAFTPTEEQQLIIDAARMTTDNLIVHALAGAAKTSTLVLIAKALPSTPMMCLAFNKRIQTEMKDRLPGNCEAFTLNSIGHRTWSSAIGRRLIVNASKTYDLVRKVIDDLPADDKSAGFDMMSDLIRNVDYGKTAGYVPTGKFSTAKPLMDDDDLFATLDEEPSSLMEELIRKVTYASIAMAMNGEIDYNDQILMPTCFHGTFPNFPLVLVDEAQDLSALNHAMLRKIVRKRLIAVGDENQSIYGFRGAHEDSMSLLRQTFNMKRLDLSISFRCPQAVVKEARFRAPSMLWPDWATEGEVKTLTEWKVATIPHDATILCRNNAPLFAMAIQLLKNGRYPELVGNDIGKSLIKTMKKLGPSGTSREDAYELLQQWVDAKEKKSRVRSTVLDQAECMRVFFEQGETLGDAIAYAEHILSISGSIKMMSIHKAKGLEWPTVFLLDRSLIRTDHVQEKNLLYVAQTRAKESLFYVTFDGFISL